MRLLFLTAETFPTFRADVMALFGKYLPRHGIYSDIVAGRAPGQSGPVTWNGGETYLCDVSGGQAKKHIKIFLHGVRRLFAAHHNRYIAIQVRDLPLLATVGLLAARLKGLPFYYWMSFPMPEAQIERARERGLSAGMMKFLFPWLQGRIGRFLLYRLVLPLSDHVFVQSERMKQDMIERGIAAKRMTAVPMGVDMEWIDDLAITPSEDPRLSGHRVIVYLGTLDRTRHIERLFSILQRVREAIPSALLVLAGDTEDSNHRAWLQLQATATGVADHVIWTGWLPMNEGWKYVAAAEVALSPFPRGFLLDSASPTKVLEYLALGVPVVCNDNPDQQSLILGTGAGRCVPYTAESFAEAVIEVLRLDRASLGPYLANATELIREARSYAAISLVVADSYSRISA